MRRLIVAVGIVLAMTPHFGRALGFRGAVDDRCRDTRDDGSNATDIACRLESHCQRTHPV